MNQPAKYDAVAIGGGFFGCTIALYLKNYFKNILVLEKEADLLQRASYTNQARVHNGYHYPRSILTARRSQIDFPNFVKRYRECVISDFESYYAIGKIFSKVNATQFKTFCDRIGAPLSPAPLSVAKLFNSDLIEAVFTTQEYVFDAVKLKEITYRELAENRIEVKLNSEVTYLEDKGHSQIEVNFINKGIPDAILTKYVFNCTYSAINTILKASNLPTVPLKHELTEMPLVKVPEAIANMGVTVMCGPFFLSCLFPQGTCILSLTSAILLTLKVIFTQTRTFTNRQLARLTTLMQLEMQLGICQF